MANRLILRDVKDYPWGNVEARVLWSGGGQDKVWINSDGYGEFGGSGFIRGVQVAGEELPVIPARVDGRTTVQAKSNKSH